MVLQIKLPLPLHYGNSVYIPDRVVHKIAINLHDYRDLYNFSIVNKQVYELICTDSSLWVQYLKTLRVWETRPQNTQIELKNDKIASGSFTSGGENSLLSLDDDSSMDPLNCFDTIVSSELLARQHFLKIYSIMQPIVISLLVRNNRDASELGLFKKYNTPQLQAKLFSNVIRFLQLYEGADSRGYDTILLRLDTMLNLFVNTVTREIGIQLDKRNFKAVKVLIAALDALKVENQQLTVDPLNSLIEFFISRYSDGFSTCTDPKIVESVFKEADESTEGAVNGYKLSFDKLDSIFDQKIASLMNADLQEIGMAFVEPSKNKSEMNEVPIVLKVIETFLSNYLIGGLIDAIVNKAKEIDAKGGESTEEIVEKKELDKLLDKSNDTENEPEETKEPTPIVQDDANVWNDDAGLVTSEIEELKLKTDDKDETLPARSTSDRSDSRINIMNMGSLFFQSVPYIHYKLISTLQNLEYPETMVELGKGKTEKMNYINIACGFVNMYYEPYLIDFSEQLPMKCIESLKFMIKTWKSNKMDDRKKMEGEIMRMVDDPGTKKKNFDMFSSFSNIFNFRSNKKLKSTSDGELKTSEDTKEEGDGVTKITKMAAKLKILQSNVEEMKSLVNVDLTVLALQHVKNSYDLLLGLTKYSMTSDLKTQLYSTCSDIFINMLGVLIHDHIQPGFNEALATLRDYKPTKFEGKFNANSVAVVPLNSFVELVKVGDFVLQMVTVFYQKELVANGVVKSKSGKYKDFLSMSPCEKEIKNFETILDTYVADGLNISIGVIISEVSYTIQSCGADETTYQISASNNSVYINDKATEWVLRSVQILDTHFSMLQSSIDKAILDVFNQEVGERFVAIFIKLLTQRFIISVTGAMPFIRDVNFLYSFFQRYRVKATVQYFASFKKISQLYLIDCSENNKQCKELGKLIIDIGRDNGIFSPEEVYRFVSRRSDWLKIKKAVDKIMYGFTPEDCIIM